MPDSVLTRESRVLVVYEAGKSDTRYLIRYYLSVAQYRCSTEWALKTPRRTVSTYYSSARLITTHLGNVEAEMGGAVQYSIEIDVFES